MALASTWGYVGSETGSCDVQTELGDGFSVEVYGTVGDDCRKLMESFGLPLKLFETRLGYSRV